MPKYFDDFGTNFSEKTPAVPKGVGTNKASLKLPRDYLKNATLKKNSLKFKFCWNQAQVTDTQFLESFIIKESEELSSLQA